MMHINDSKSVFRRKLIFNALILFYAFIFVFIAQPCCAGREWEEIKGDHFMVYYTDDTGFAKDVLKNAEKYYKSIAEELGYQRYSNFWTWENRVKIYVYPDKDAFRQATGQAEWSEGMADYNNKQIISYAWSQNFVEALLPHEITHLIFRDFVGIDASLPLWMDEGVAQWMEPQKRKLLKSFMRQLLVSGKLIPLSVLMEMDIRASDDNALINIYYAEAASLIGFLISDYGSKNFIEFCRQIRDKKNIPDALIFAYPTRARDLETLEKEWLEFYGRRN